MESLTLLTGTFFIGRSKKISITATIIVYTIITLMLVYSILLSDIFPECFIEGQGQAMFKVVSEYVINAILIISMIILWRKKGILC